MVRVVCDPYAFDRPAPDTPRLANDWHLIGFTIFARDRIEQARLRALGIRAVLAWDVQSKSMSLAEKAAFLRSLPTGVIHGPIVSGPLPIIPPEERVSVLGIAVFDEGSQLCASADSLGALAANGRLLHSDPSFLTMQGYPSFVVDESRFTVWLAAISILVGVGIFAWRRARSPRR